MRVVFMGTPQLAATVLRALAGRHEVVGAFTRPDAVRGRGRKLVASPVKEAASELGIDAFTPPTLRADDAVRQIASLAPDVICVAAYGCILPKAVLDIPRHGCLNVHTSLLPRWRGAAPIERAILAGDERTGVCIMKMEEGLDTGPYCVRREVPAGRSYVGELASRLAEEGASALLEALDLVEAGRAEWTAQGGADATYAAKIGKGELDFGPDEEVSAIDAKVRASSESHPSRIEVAGRRISVERVSPASADSEDAGVAPGAAALHAKRLLIGALDGAVELEQVKPDGKKSMDGRAFAAGIQGIKGQQVEWGRA